MSHLPLSSTHNIVALLLGIVAGLAGCASVPEPLRGGPQQSPDPAMVRASPEQYAGVMVRWGGVIVTVKNEAAQSLVQVVSRPLGESTRPLETDESWGRFFASISSFIDPVDYAAGREITVIGVIDGVEQHDIGTYRYSYPLVRATAHYLWPVRLPPVQDPYYYSPFYRPWHPYGLYPYP